MQGVFQPSYKLLETRIQLMLPLHQSRSRTAVIGKTFLWMGAPVFFCGPQPPSVPLTMYVFFVLTFLIVGNVGAINSLTPRYYLFHVMFQGAPYELFVKGNMRANFSPASNKLISAEIQFDTGSVVDQLQDLIVPKIDDEHLGSDLCDGVATAAAQAALNAAANEADALLDSLQMPQLDASVPSAISVASGSSAAVSVTSSEKSDCSSDESIGEGKQDSSSNSSALSRRSLRRKD